MSNSANDTESNSNPPTPKTDSGYGDPAPKKEVETEPKDAIQEMYEGEVTKEDKEEPKVEPKKEEEKIDPSTGYEKDLDAPKEEPKVEDKDKSPELLKEEEVKEVLKTLPKGFDADKISKFAIDTKMTKEQVEAYVAFVKQDSEAIKADHANQVLTTRKAWKEELLNDSTFGGENFDQNRHKVDTLLQKHMPNMKKNLTDNGNMLPPYLMKDLLTISNLLNPKTELVGGEVSKPVEKERDVLKEMYG